jgi:thiol-disulfide isomerase/thioredoxin
MPVKQKKTSTRKTRNVNKKKATRSNQHKVDPATLGLVYAEWCGHCQQLKPEWASMKEEIDADVELKPRIEIIEIESEDPSLKQKMEHLNQGVVGEPLSVEGYPTIFMKKNNAIHRYQGNRDAQSIKQWAGDVVKGGSSIYGGKRSRKYRAKKTRTSFFGLW